MTSTKLLAAGLFAIAAVASGSVSAKIVNSSYYVPGDTSYQLKPTQVADRAVIKSETRAAMPSMHQPRTEFGAGSHDTTRSIRSRAEVKSEAVSYERASSHAPFTY
jgi:hypothetical protein